MRLLDLFCGAGGAAMGYHRAGFDEIVGVDISAQPHYPFEFVQADAMTFPLDGFDAIHASPPCQAYSPTRAIHPEIRRLDLVAGVRTKLEAAGVPFVIENVPGSPLHATWVLCGLMFGLPLYRHRLFEAPWRLWNVGPRHRAHEWPTTSKHGGKDYYTAPIVTVAGHNSNRGMAARAMGIDWMTRDEMNQAVPPAYTEYIGQYLMPELTKT